MGVRKDCLPLRCVKSMCVCVCVELTKDVKTSFVFWLMDVPGTITVIK